MDEENPSKRTGLRSRRGLALISVLVLAILAGGLLTVHFRGEAADRSAVQQEPPGTQQGPEPGGGESAASSAPADGAADGPVVADGSGGETGGAADRTSSGQPPASGTLNDALPPLAPAVSLDRPADVGDGVEVTVGSFEAVEGDPGGAADAGGPSIRFKVTVSNRTESTVSLDEAVVNVEAGPEASPATQLSGPGATAFPATLGAGESASAVLVFRVAPELRQSLRILFHYQATTPIAAFEGPMPLSEGKQ